MCRTVSHLLRVFADGRPTFLVPRGLVKNLLNEAQSRWVTPSMPGHAYVAGYPAGRVALTWVSEQRHEAFAVECLEPCLHVTPLLLLGLFGHNRLVLSQSLTRL
jgi:hypothetical protein